jgi:hypothetical protein
MATDQSRDLTAWTVEDKSDVAGWAIVPLLDATEGDNLAADSVRRTESRANLIGVETDGQIGDCLLRRRKRLPRQHQSGQGEKQTERKPCGKHDP